MSDNNVTTMQRDLLDCPPWCAASHGDDGAVLTDIGVADWRSARGEALACGDWPIIGHESATDWPPEGAPFLTPLTYAHRVDVIGEEGRVEGRVLLSIMAGVHTVDIEPESVRDLAAQLLALADLLAV